MGGEDKPPVQPSPVVALLGLLTPILLHVLGLVLIVLDLALWFVTGGVLRTLYGHATKRTVFAAPAGEADVNGPGQTPSKVWRSVEAIAAGELINDPPNLGGECHTAYEALARAYKVHADRPAQLIRPLLSWRTEAGYRFPAKVFGPTITKTFAQLGEEAHAFGAGLRALGLKPQPASLASKDHAGLLIYEDTCAEWFVAAHGAFSQDIVVATSYATLGASAVEKAVKQGGAKAVMCNRKALPQVLELVTKMPSLVAIIYTDNLCTPEEIAAPPATPKRRSKKLSVLSHAEVIELGRANPVAPTPPRPESVAVLMYTSGSTGDPKGVMVRQSNILAMVAAVAVQLASSPDYVENGEVYLGYLPAAHIIELCSEVFFHAYGSAVGYADAKSLLTGPERAYPNGALDEFKPTVMCGVPKVWEGIQSGALAKVKKMGPVLNFLISLAVRMKALGARQRRSTPVFALLLKSFKRLVGGRLKMCLSGGGAISAEVQEWGYGLTECCAGATFQMPDDTSIGIAGTPISSMEIVLHSEPEIQDADGNAYMTTDTSHIDGTACAGRGEVWVRGHNVTGGYYKMPDLTMSEFRADGFFQTGDIGMLTPGGALVIIDRKKNLVKLKGGEYVALDRMNTVYRASPFVNVEAGGVCCFADASLDRAVALVQCKESELIKAAEEGGVIFSDVSELQTNPTVQAALLKSLVATAKAAGLVPLEQVTGAYPLLDPWLTENGCLTATLKLVPKAVFKRQAKELDIVKAKGRRS